MTTTPTEPLPEWAHTAPVPRRRRHGWVWLVALLIVAGLAVAAWFLGEMIARDFVTKTIRDQIVTQLALPEDQDIDVQIAGTVLPQLIAGTLDVVTISSDDLPVGPTSADVTVRAAGIPIRGDGPISAAQGTVVLDEADVRALVQAAPDVPIDDLTLEEPIVRVSLSFQVLGVQIPVGATLTPLASDGDLVLSPRSYEISGAHFAVDDLRSRFGSAVDPLTADRTVCIAQYLPAGLTLQHVAVSGDTIVAGFSVDGRIAQDVSLQQPGTCA